MSQSLCKEPAWLLLEAWAACGSCGALGWLHASFPAPAAHCRVPGLPLCWAGMGPAALALALTLCPVKAAVLSPLCRGGTGLRSCGQASGVSLFYAQWVMVQVGLERSTNRGWAYICWNFTDHGPMCSETPVVSLEEQGWGGIHGSCSFYDT